MAIIGVDDISFYKDNKWHSIIDSSFYINNKWNNFELGSGVHKDGNWYVVKSIPMILEHKITSPNMRVSLPFIDVIELTIDWGDGSEMEIFTNNLIYHYYDDIGVYDVKIIGTVQRMYTKSTSYEPMPLTRIKSWGKLDGLISMDTAFSNYSLLEEISEDKYGCLRNVTDFHYCFSNCSKLTEIPENLFSNSFNVTSFSNCFKDCTSLTSIPENLFANCPNVTNFENCFYRCAGLTSIPENLFINCPNVTNFMSCFDSCYNLTSIPEKLFSNCFKIDNLMNCFDSCVNLTGETPKDTLEDGAKIELWERQGREGYPVSVNGNKCFYNCRNLSNYDEIPTIWK
jgi:hypothetical protein